MVDRREDLLNRAIELSDLLNKCLENYLHRTKDLTKVLGNKDQDGSRILEILAQRETLIKQHDGLKEEYEQLLTRLEGEHETERKPQSDPKPEPDNERERAEWKGKLANLRKEREKLLADLLQLDDQNKKQLELLLIDQKSKLKQVNHGRKLLGAYYGSVSSREGVYIDKTK